MRRTRGPEEESCPRAHGERLAVVLRPTRNPATVIEQRRRIKVPRDAIGTWIASPLLSPPRSPALPSTSEAAGPARERGTCAGWLVRGGDRARSTEKCDPRRSPGVANGSPGGSCPEQQVQKRGRRTGRRAEGTPNCTPLHAERDRTPEPARPTSAQHGNARRRARPIGDRHAPGARPRCVRRSLRSALASTRRPSAAVASAGGGSDPPGTRAS
ncbi:hypothetical protein IscW_ISCW023756 [Ixodes scapularis]|uniref:Uncharacterized protein n=1 Tax=Ixodes scapularis TaxID=6945 RepID=B7QIN0_IXOSC|nr:hypothetical protein IscW_ISCW023756 [Ixodes scapularis]|eukprot:XP_002415037.1 hypothetical protein IscW_ISCW023756 [Ixodes scapularis]